MPKRPWNAPGSRSHDEWMHRKKQFSVMKYPRPATGLVDQIIYDMEAFHRMYPALLKRRSTVSD